MYSLELNVLLEYLSAKLIRQVIKYNVSRFKNESSLLFYIYSYFTVMGVKINKRIFFIHAVVNILYFYSLSNSFGRLRPSNRNH